MFVFVQSQRSCCAGPTHMPWQNKYLSIGCSRAACTAVLQRDLPPLPLNRFVARITTHAHFCSFGLLISCHQLMWNHLEVKTSFLLHLSARIDSDPLSVIPPLWDLGDALLIRQPSGSFGMACKRHMEEDAPFH